MAKKQRPDDQLGFLAHRVAIAHQARLVLALMKNMCAFLCAEKFRTCPGRYRFVTYEQARGNSNLTSPTIFPETHDSNVMRFLAITVCLPRFSIDGRRFNHQTRIQT
jgi:hypothetical protein